MADDINIFLILDLDPSARWDQAEFERCLQENIREWSRLVNLPNKKGLAAKKNLGNVSKIKEIANKEELRQQQAKEAQQQVKQAQKDLFSELDQTLSLMQSKGHVLEEEVQDLIKQFAGSITEAEIRKRIRVPIEAKPKETKSKRPSLEPSLAKTIHTKLNSLNRTNLYELLELSPATASNILHQKASQLYTATNKATKTVENTTISELTGYCLNIFSSEQEREKYDETLRLQAYDQIKDQIDAIARVTKQIDANQTKQLLRIAKAQRLDIDETISVIKDLARQRSYFVDFSQQSQEQIQALIQCGYCQSLNSPSQKHCNQCGKSLRDPCPKCSKEALSSDGACGSCGFPLGNRAWVITLITEAQQSHRTRDYTQALNYLHDATQAWPAGQQNSLSQEIQRLQAEYTPLKAEQDKHKQEMEAAMTAKRFYTARSLLPKLEQSFPVQDPAIDAYRKAIASKISETEKKIQQANQVNVRDSETAVQIYQEALSICQDSQDALDKLSQTPPKPPGPVQAKVGDKVINLTWQPSPSHGVRYTIIRKKMSRPISVNDGENLATVSGTIYDDNAIAVGVPTFYAVFADRSGVSSLTGSVIAKPIMQLQEVTQLVADIDDQQVHLHWQSPPNVHHIIIRRSEHRPVNHFEDGQPIALVDKTQAIDKQVQNGQRYYYTLFCQFRDYEGSIHTTKGVSIEAIPQSPPQAIQNLTITAEGPVQQRRVKLQWALPAKGDVVILKANQQTGLSLGARIPRQELPNYGQILTVSTNQFIDTVEKLGFYYYIPVVLFQNTAYIGKEHEYICIDDVADLSVQNLGHVLRLQWTWPPNCYEVNIAYNHNGWPQLSDPRTIVIPLMRAQYDLRGYYDILNPSQQDYYITVFAVVSQNNQKIISSGIDESARKKVFLRSRITLNYEIKKTWLGKWFLYLYIKEGAGQPLPELLLTRKPKTLPMNRQDGQVILQQAVIDANGTTVKIPLDDDIKQEQAYAKLFLMDDTAYDFVVIRHPDRDKLKVF